eukprot:3872892-Pleurochrysis_carterae.AAC.1
MHFSRFAWSCKCHRRFALEPCQSPPTPSLPAWRPPALSASGLFCLFAAVHLRQVQETSQSEPALTSSKAADARACKRTSPPVHSSRKRRLAQKH